MVQMTNEFITDVIAITEETVLYSRDADSLRSV